MPIRNIPAILEVLADNGEVTRDSEALTEMVRQRLGRSICDMHADRNGTLYAVTLDPILESKLAQAVSGGDGGVNPAWLQKVIERVAGPWPPPVRTAAMRSCSCVRTCAVSSANSCAPRCQVAVLHNEVVPAKAIETIHRDDGGLR
ncbi:MAG: FHIPEP family type III secretion protein [Planctomycetota bacterium]